MPFTISHVAVALPFARKLSQWRMLSASVIGTMLPDFSYLLPWHLVRSETHSAAALLTFCLPVGLASYWIFQRIIRTPLLELLPDETYIRWQMRPDLGRLRQWAFALCGLLGGAVTHLIWDGFTHEGARGVRMFPALDDPMLDVGGHQLLGFKLMQQASSLLGFVVVLWFLWRTLRPAITLHRTGAMQRLLGERERRAWIGVYALTTIGFGIAWIWSMRLWGTHGHYFGAVNDLAIGGLRGLATSLVATSLCVQLRLRAARL